ncbi:MAG: ATP-binding cassette domain-containing protein [Acidimicrobiia bacterium]
MSALLEATGLFAGYHGVSVVRNLDLRVEPGEVVALLGPNGAGKTTTLLTLSGLLPLIEGSVTVLGEPVNPTRAHRIARRGLAHVLEGRGLFFGLTVGENLRLGRPRSASELRRALDYFPALAPILDRRAGLLSGGEQQMLALARALVGGPRLILIDELSLGLAPIIVENLLPLIRTIAHETGAGVLLVEQHVHLALEVSDRAYVMVHGEVGIEADSAELVGRRDLLEVSYLGETAL